MLRGLCYLSVCYLAAVTASDFYSLEADDLEAGLPVPMRFYEGKVVLIANLASQCGTRNIRLTPLPIST